MGKKTVHLVGLAAFLNQSQMICLKFRPVFFFRHERILQKQYYIKNISLYIYIFFLINNFNKLTEYYYLYYAIVFL